MVAFAHPATASDWLVDEIKTPAAVHEWGGDPVFRALELSNGLISRVFSTRPNWPAGGLCPVDRHALGVASAKQLHPRRRRRFGG